MNLSNLTSVMLSPQDRPHLLVGAVSVLSRAPRRSRPVNKSTTVAIVVVVITLPARPVEAQTVIVLISAVSIIATIVTARVLARLAADRSPLNLSSLGVSALSTAPVLVVINLAVLKIFSPLALLP